MTSLNLTNERTLAFLELLSEPKISVCCVVFFFFKSLCFFLPLCKGLLVIMSYACCRLHTPQIMSRKTIYFKHVSSDTRLVRANAEIVYLVKSCGDIRTMSPSPSTTYCVMSREYQYKNKSSIVIITIKMLASCPSKNPI